MARADGEAVAESGEEVARGRGRRDLAVALWERGEAAVEHVFPEQARDELVRMREIPLGDAAELAHFLHASGDLVVFACEKDACSGDGVLALAPARKHVILPCLVAHFLDTEKDLLGGITDHATDVHLAAILLNQRKPNVPTVRRPLADHGPLRFLQRLGEPRVAVPEGNLRPEILDAFQLGVAGRSDTDSGLIGAFVVGECLRGRD